MSSPASWMDRTLPCSPLLGERRLLPAGCDLTVFRKATEVAKADARAFAVANHAELQLVQEVFDQLRACMPDAVRQDSAPIAWEIQVRQSDVVLAEATSGLVDVHSGLVASIRGFETDRPPASGSLAGKSVEERVKVQVAFVLAHEMAHSIERHPEQRFVRESFYPVAKTIVFGACVAMFRLTAVGRLLSVAVWCATAGKMLSGIFQSEEGPQRVGLAIAVVGVCALWWAPLLMQAFSGYAILALASNLLDFACSRRFETQADRGGLILMTKAGFDPEGASRYFEFQRALDEQQGVFVPAGFLQRIRAYVAEFFDTHPSDATRAANILRWREEQAPQQPRASAQATA